MQNIINFYFVIVKKNSKNTGGNENTFTFAFSINSIHFLTIFGQLTKLYFALAIKSRKVLCANVAATLLLLPKENQKERMNFGRE